MYSRLTLTPRGYRRFLSGHPWLYRGDVGSAESATSGDIIAIDDVRGRRLGYGWYSSQSLITVRILSRDEEPTNSSFRRWIERAIELRRRIQPGRSMERLVHGESDGIPSLVVDRYEDVIVMQTLSAGTDRMKPTLIQILQEVLSPRSIVERNDPAVRKLEGLPESVAVAAGEDVQEVWSEEGGLRLMVRPRSGQKTGLFLDQQENHLAAASYARGRVLDCFSYQGGFALQAAARAESVIAVDASAEALQVLRDNCRANGLTNVETEEANVFDRLTDFARLHQKFDMIILDPPAFAKNRQALPGALRGYKEINLRAMSLLEPGGILVTSSCSYHLQENEFLSLLADAAHDRGRICQVLEKRTQARDHPILLPMPESYYLKCIVLRVL